jgi:hypothetical protein
MTTLTIGDRVQLAKCDGPVGTVLDITQRGKIVVQFDGEPGCKWVLRPGSVRRASTTDG